MLVRGLLYPHSRAGSALPKDLARRVGRPLRWYSRWFACLWGQHLDRERKEERRDGALCSAQSFESLNIGKMVAQQAPSGPVCRMVSSPTTRWFASETTMM